MELYKKELNKKIQEVVIQDNFLIIFDDGSIFKIVSKHIEDYDERVYADFSYARDYLEQLKTKEKINYIKIIGVKDIGFIISIQTDKYDALKKVLIPCYNEQNGYYSNNLELEISYKHIKTKIDLMGYIEDCIE